MQKEFSAAFLLLLHCLLHTCSPACATATEVDGHELISIGEAVERVCWREADDFGW
jgi:hypothetical protein